MITQASTSDHFKACYQFAKVDSMTTQAFVDALEQCDVFIMETQDRIVGFYVAAQYDLSLHKRWVKVAYMHSIHGSDAVKEVLHTHFESEYAKHNLVALTKHGLLDYDPVVFEHRYNIQPSVLLHMNVDGIVVEPSLEACVTLSTEFFSHFTGYFKRDLEYMERLKKRVRAEGLQWVGIVEDDALMGYIIFKPRGSWIEVFECLYLKSSALMKLLSYATRQGGRLVLSLSPQEQLQKVLPDVIFEKITTMDAKILQPELFERLYRVKIVSAVSGFYAFGMPVFNRELTMNLD